MQTKDFLITEILRGIQPNSHESGHPYWERINRGLRRLDMIQLTALMALVKGQHTKGGKK